MGCEVYSCVQAILVCFSRVNELESDRSIGQASGVLKPVRGRGPEPVPFVSCYTSANDHRGPVTRA